MADHSGGPGRVARSRGKLGHGFSLLDILGASLAGREPQILKWDELRFWLKCRGDSLKGLKTKAALVKR